MVSPLGLSLDGEFLARAAPRTRGQGTTKDPPPMSPDPTYRLTPSERPLSGVLPSANGDLLFCVINLLDLIVAKHEVRPEPLEADLTEEPVLLHLGDDQIEWFNQIASLGEGEAELITG